MFNKRFTAAVMAGGLIVAPFAAQAQTATTPNTGTSTGTAAQSTTTMPSSGSTAATATAGSQQFASQLMPNQWLASKLMDQSVLGPDNKSVGDINDLVLDQSGNIQSVVIGVGGFLGIGEKDVAVPFRSLEIQHDASASTTGTTTTGTSTSSTANNATTTTAANNNSSGSSLLGTSKDRIVLRMSKQELQNAPTFRSDRSSTSGAASGSSSDTGMGSSTTTGTGTTTTAPAR